jgi:hypothetical protein
VELLSHRIAANFNRLFAAIAPASANVKRNNV